MGRKLAKTVVMVLLVGLVSATAADAADPNLVGWWEFDGNGLDSSGNGRDGILEGDAHFEPGHLGQALALDGDGDYFTVTDYKGLMSASAITITAWVQTTGNGDIVFWGRTGGGRRVEFRVAGGELRIENGRGNLVGNTTMNDGEWHHVAVTIPPDAEISYPYVKLYLDGADDTLPATDPENHTFRLADHDANVDVDIGRRVGFTNERHFPGLIDDVRLYDRVLVRGEIQDIMDVGYFASAHSPSIPDGGKFEETWAMLEWVPGPLAVSHNVYFGTSFEDVNAGAEAAFVGNTTANSQVVGVQGYPAGEGLASGMTYYWRVEAVNDAHPDSPWRGRVWGFWIPEETAYDPVPADGEPFEDPNLVLSWAPGRKARFGTVYFGTDANVVANETGGPSLMETTYDPRPLEPDTTYYWRADTFNGTEWVKGPLWSFKTMPEIPLADDPNLIVWYTFDEGAGTNVVDWSGHGSHAKLFGPQWLDAGVVGGGALAFDAAEGDYVAIRNLYYDDANNAEVTVSVWVRTTDPNHQVVASFDRNEFWRMELNTELANAPVGPGRVGWHVMTNSGDLQVDYGSFLRVDDGQWHHLCGVFDNGEMTIYIDGDPERPASGGPTFGDEIVRYGFLGTGSEATEFNGTPRTPASHFNGDMDDFRIYDRALTPEEVLELTRGDPLGAWDPQPRTGRVFEVGTITSVRWEGGDDAAEHDIYFGTDAAAVAGADASDATGVYRGRRTGTTYVPSEDLEWGQTYYWRIDEVNADGSITTGRVLMFTIADYVIVDDFESYTDTIETGEAIYETWIDGLTNLTGSMVGYWQAPFAERRIVHGGGQSMPLDYNNVNSPWYSEAERTWETAQNWTVNAVDTLTLYFTAGPLADPNVQGLASLYVGVEDSTGRVAVVNYPDPNAVRQTEWLEWNIPLAELSAAGVNVAKVKKMVIGVGDRSAPVPDGAGLIYIDDIRLTKPAPPAVENFSFELPGTDKQTGFDNVPGWSTDGPCANSGVETGWTPTDGEWTAYLMAGDPPVWQSAERTINQSDVYELKVDARITWEATTLRMCLYYDKAGVRVPVATSEVALTGDMQEYTLAFAASDVPASVGRKIGIEFANVSAGGESWLGLDNVRLDLVGAQ